MKRHFRQRSLIFSPLLLLLLFLHSCSKSEPDPFDDNRYLVSSKLEFMRTEDNIRTVLTFLSNAYPFLEDLSEDVVSGVNFYSITYRTSFGGNEVIASGLITIPSVPGTYPILAIQNGTNTLHSAAPTADPENMYVQLAGYLASAGYVVVIADYLGFGASQSMSHPYLHKESTVRSLVDILRSVSEFDEDVAKDISVTNECYLMGYSQGGWSTLALLEALEREHSSEFTVKGACCGAGPYDLVSFTEYVLGLTTYPGSAFLGYIANAYSTYSLFPNTLDELFRPPYAARIAALYDGKHSGEQITAQLTSSISLLFTPEYISGFSSDPQFSAVYTALADNGVRPWKTRVPLLFLHGTADEIVPTAITSATHQGMLDKGSNPLTCLYLPMAGANHGDGGGLALYAGYEFLKAVRQ